MRFIEVDYIYNFGPTPARCTTNKVFINVDLISGVGSYKYSTDISYIQIVSIGNQWTLPIPATDENIKLWIEQNLVRSPANIIKRGGTI